MNVENTLKHWRATGSKNIQAPNCWGFYRHAHCSGQTPHAPTWCPQQPEKKTFRLFFLVQSKHLCLLSENCALFPLTNLQIKKLPPWSRNISTVPLRTAVVYKLEGSGQVALPASHQYAAKVLGWVSLKTKTLQIANIIVFFFPHKNRFLKFSPCERFFILGWEGQFDFGQTFI